MPLIDKPLPELLTYAGTNPRPADFDAYWDAALAELDGIDPAPELIPNPTIRSEKTEAFDLSFRSVGGARIHAKYLRPRNASSPHPAVLNFHGYSGASGDWSDFLGYTSEGLAVASLDVRGQAGQSQDSVPVLGTTLNGHIIRGLDDAPERLFFRNVFLDTAQLARVVMALPEVDGDRVGAFGSSQGGALTFTCAALEPRIRRAAIVYPFLSDYRRVWEMDLCKDAYAELRYFFRSFDPRHERETAIFERLGYIDIQFLAPRVKADVLFATGLMDTVCPPSSQFAAYNKLTCPRELRVFPDFAHERLPGFNDEMFNFLTSL